MNAHFWIIGILSFLATGMQASQAQTITDEIQNCDNALIPKALITSTGRSEPACIENTTPEEYAKACADPVGYVCSKQARGRIYDSKCKINFNDPKDIAQTPDFIQVKSKIDLQKTKFFMDHEKECPKTPNSDCASFLKDKYSRQIINIEQKAAYTPDRMQKLQSEFTQVKSTMMDLIKNSKQIPAGSKNFLMNRIKTTQLLDPLKQKVSDPCYQLGPDGPDSGIYNDGEGKIHFCIGAIAMLERESEASLLLTLGHELSHSIDPCALDALSQYSGSGSSPTNGDSTYSSLITCLRGGARDQNGCEQMTLHCNTPENIKANCASEVKSDSGNDFDACMNTSAREPNCPLAPFGGNAPGEDLSHYRNEGKPVDQIQESFADFIGAQVYSKILENRGASEGAMDLQTKADQLMSLGTDFATLHGICLDQNTLDVHPPGRIRMKSIILRQKGFSSFFCPQNTQKSCEGF